MSEHDDARALVALYDERCRMVSVLAAERQYDREKYQAVVDKGAELDAACEAFRRRYYPRRAEVVVGLWQVIVASRTRRSLTTVLDLFDEYHAQEVSAGSLVRAPGGGMLGAQ